MSRGSLLTLLLLLGAARVAEAQPSASAADETEARERAEDAYERAFIVFEDEYAALISLRDHGYAIHGTVTTTRNAVPIRGIQRERLSPIEFYEGVGRADLAAEYQAGRRKKLVVGGISVGSAVAGVVLFGVGMSKMSDAFSVDLNCSQYAPTIDDLSWAAYDACRAEENRQSDRASGTAMRWFAGGGAAFLGAIALGALYRYLDPHPVSESERRVMAHDHNARLRQELRLPRKRRDVSVTPFVTGDGGGFLATGRF